VLIIAGEDDRIVGLQASKEMHKEIPDSRIHIYKGLGHGAYEEAKDFYQRVFGFLVEGENA
jgi:pimeloyl-ACP methyl ester carboxylesterase